MPSGVILYGPPGSGKDTVTNELTRLRPEFALFERLKAGPGRTTGYRLTTGDHIEELSRAGGLLYRNARYGAEYAIDRHGVAALVDADRIPVLHVGQVMGVYAVAAFPLHWIRVLLWCPLDSTESRSTGRGDKDVEARMKAWHETREDLLDHASEPWTLMLRTDQMSPTESANAIIDAFTATASAESRNIRELVG
ncbi:P-loop NTPase family protein [Streptomyces triticiradicis]|uniref:Guanylate kinase n=1 Tax=Streptomyces triticiradicis TaxID=2651189 RepID=A0A7J5D8P3_9ACTN|nr:guanylate kinase [Streptomyces triticiradicis]KAB1983414.1 guanylate kinase [Streptomyces triticiradicis]